MARSRRGARRLRPKPSRASPTAHNRRSRPGGPDRRDHGGVPGPSSRRAIRRPASMFRRDGRRCLDIRPPDRRLQPHLDAGCHQRRAALSRKAVALSLAALLLLAALAWWWLSRPAALLTEAQFSDLPGWAAADLNPALAAFRRSCAVIAGKPPTEAIGDYAGTAADWRKACAQISGDARSFFEKNFTPYALRGEGLFTGYYEPEIHGSRTRQWRLPDARLWPARRPDPGRSRPVPRRNTKASIFPGG